MAERPGLGRDDSYNRVTVSRDLKSQIMSMIADSSESLPLHQIPESEENLPAAQETDHVAPPTSTNGTSKLATEEPLNVADIATPTPEKPNPLEQVPTETLGTTASRATTVSQTPSNATGSKTERPGMDKRQSTMKRISSVFKKSTSKNQ